MTYEAFSEYALYLTLREFLRVNQGAEAVQSLDESYSKGSKINSEALLKHPMGRQIAALGRAMHEGGVLPGWNNVDGTMNWARYSNFSRWFAKLNKTQKPIAIARMRAGSETPWTNVVPGSPAKRAQAPSPAVQAVVQEIQTANPSLSGGSVGPETQQQGGVGCGTTALALPGSSGQMQAPAAETGGIGTAGWLAIIAALVGVGFMIYKMFDKKPPEQPAPEQETA